MLAEENAHPLQSDTVHLAFNTLLRNEKKLPGTTNPFPVAAGKMVTVESSAQKHFESAQRSKVNTEQQLKEVVVAPARLVAELKSTTIEAPALVNVADCSDGGVGGTNTELTVKEFRFAYETLYLELALPEIDSVALYEPAVGTPTNEAVAVSDLLALVKVKVLGKKASTPAIESKVTTRVSPADGATLRANTTAFN